MSKSLEGKIAVVTGASTGIGLAVAKRFVAEGAKVVITGRRQAELDLAVQSIGENATGFRADASKLEELDALFEAVLSQHGRIDVLMANAGGGALSALGEISEEDFDNTFNLNVKGTLFTVQKALPLLSNGASVILTGSTTSVMGTASFSVYSASKAALRNFARSWMLDLKGRNVRVNVLSPGPVKTSLLLGLAPAGHQEAMLSDIASRIPMGRVGDPDEIGKVAVFLASDASSFVNGVELFADGGFAQV